MGSDSLVLPKSLAPFIWRYLRRQKWCLTGFTVVSLVWACQLSFAPYLLKVMIDTVMNDKHGNAQLMAAIILPAILYVSLPMVLNFNFRFYQYINLRLYPALKSAIGLDIFQYLLHHSHDYFQNTFTGNLTKKIGDLVEIESLISIPNEWFFPRFIALIIASVTLFTVVHPIFGIILFVWTVVFIYFSYLAAKNSEQLSRAYSESGSKMSGTMADSIANVISTKLFGNIQNEVSHLKQEIDQLVVNDRRLQWYILKVSFVQGVGVTILTACMTCTLIIGRLHGWVSVGDFALVLALSASFVDAVYGVGQQMQAFSKVVGTCNQALQFIVKPHEVVERSDARPIVIRQGKINFDKVNFHYEKKSPLFKGLSVTIQPGEKVGLVGYSGGGKSTFIKLILRIMDIDSGCISIDDQDIKSVTKNSLAKQIAIIPQDSDLFHRSIMENIRFARLDATDEEVIDAATKARCHEFIMAMPEAYHSKVGERGVKLSGGQKQRIAIARAFIKNAPILLLDEATSSLDSITEQAIKESLHEVMQHKTTLVIAHRLSTLKDMDRILVFVNGCIIEDGSLELLLADPHSHLFRLWQMQAAGFIPSIESL